jgi:hypothetical protein
MVNCRRVGEGGKQVAESLLGEMRREGVRFSQYFVLFADRSDEKCRFLDGHSNTQQTRNSAQTCRGTFPLICLLPYGIRHENLHRNDHIGLACWLRQHVSIIQWRQYVCTIQRKQHGLYTRIRLWTGRFRTGMDIPLLDKLKSGSPSRDGLALQAATSPVAAYRRISRRPNRSS